MASDWDRAGAVVNLLWGRWPDGEFSSWRNSGVVTVCFAGNRIRYPSSDVPTYFGKGPTYVAALIDLGTKLDADTEAERQELED